MRITISTKRTIQILALVIICLTLANLAAQFYKLEPLIGLGPTLDFNEDGTMATFDFEEEANIPSWYSSFMLLLCSVLLAMIAAVKKGGGERYALHWYALSVIFLLMSVDETATIHEKVGSAIGRFFDAGGIFYYAWVIPASVFLLAFGLVMLNFLFDLPSKTRWLFIVAGIIFVGGALALEMVEGRHNSLYGTADITGALLGNGQELLEMLGILVFIYALMSYISTYLKDVHLYVDGK